MASSSDLAATPRAGNGSGRCSMLGGMRGTATPDGSFSPATKAAVAVRARSECERCGRWCGDGSWREFHHRIPRGMGGAASERALVLAGAANCLLLCHLCHRWVESNRAASVEAGWLVSLAGDPRMVPAIVYRRGPVLLGVEYGAVGVLGAARVVRPGRVRVSW